MPICRISYYPINSYWGSLLETLTHQFICPSFDINPNRLLGALHNFSRRGYTMKSHNQSAHDSGFLASTKRCVIPSSRNSHISG